MSHLCGCYYVSPFETSQPEFLLSPTAPELRRLPLVSLNSHTKIVSTSSRTTLTQTFVNDQDTQIKELRYAFPLYDGISVVGFVCTINNSRTIKGVVREKEKARQIYDEAVARGETAGLLQQLPDASDVFTTTIGNVPAAAEVRVDITYLGELKHDAESDGIRFTMPATIAPRYGATPRDLHSRINSTATSRIDVVVDVEIPTTEGNYIKTIKSTSHPVSLEMKPASDGGMSAATAEVTIDSLELGKDIVLIIVPAKPDAPVAILEQHSALADQRALMVTFVPRFNLPAARPEIVFVCDRSGSMDGNRIKKLKDSLQIFLRSLPVGVKFNIVSFGTNHMFLFQRSQPYNQDTLNEATRHIDGFHADMGGTNMFKPIGEVFKRRYTDMDLEVFVLTDGQIWKQNQLFQMVNKNVADSNGAIRLFALGIGNDVSHALVEGLAQAGKGFAQIVGDHEQLSNKVVRMLKNSLTAHIHNLRLEIQYATVKGDADDFEMVEASDSETLTDKVLDALNIKIHAPKTNLASEPKKTISLFDPQADPDHNMENTTSVDDKYAHVPEVPLPKLLQAPFEPPSMFNFNRATFYVLLGPSSNRLPPRSVILRGSTRSHGDVELTIPVQSLPNPTDTVHQLSAKKAVQELEQGRGWLIHAKDVTDDKLLKDKYDGHFPDMVEREAVRLGVMFQVGGKWCSFVAVDDDGEKSAVEKQPTEGPRDKLGELEARCKALSNTHDLMASRAVVESCAVPSTGSAYGRPLRQAVHGLSGVAGGLFGSVATPLSKTSKGTPVTSSIFRLPSSSTGRSGSSMRYGGHPTPASPSAGGRRFGASCLASLSGVTVFGATSSASPSGGSPFGIISMAVASPPPPPPASPTTSKEKSESRWCRTRAAMRSDAFSVSSCSSRTSTDLLGSLVRLQAFEGFWEWNDDLFAVLGVTPETVAQAFAAASVAESVYGYSVGATACAVVFLRKKLSESKDTWEMIVNKAFQWLQETADDSETVLAAAEKLF